MRDDLDDVDIALSDALCVSVEKLPGALHIGKERFMACYSAFYVFKKKLEKHRSNMVHMTRELNGNISGWAGHCPIAPGCKSCFLTEVKNSGDCTMEKIYNNDRPTAEVMRQADRYIEDSNTYMEKKGWTWDRSNIKDEDWEAIGEVPVLEVPPPVAK